jgi:hypothetical protein
MTAMQTLKAIYMEANRRKFPNLPEYARSVYPYTDKTANGLTRCIIDFLKFSGHFAERINNTGRPIDRRQQVVDVVGRVRTIGTLQWIPGTGTRGTADISAVIRGRAVKIEVKCEATKDRQSLAQMKYQAEVQKAGGLYVIATSFPQFFEWYQQHVSGNV